MFLYTVEYTFKLCNIYIFYQEGFEEESVSCKY